MQNSSSSLGIAAAYIGTVIGAGFASGQEIMQFFIVFGHFGFIGLLLVACLFSLLGYKIMEIARLSQSPSQVMMVQAVAGKKLGIAVDFGISLFLFGSLSAMVAGSGAMLNQLFSIPLAWGNGAMALLAGYTVYKGFERIVGILGLIVPFMLLTMVATSLLILLSQKTFPCIQSLPALPASEMLPFWWLAAILYTSYNLLVALAVLIPLGSSAKNSKILKKGAILGGAGLGLCAISIGSVIYLNRQVLFDVNVPMLYASGALSPLAQYIYLLAMVAAVYTTAVGSLYGLTARIATFGQNRPGSNKAMWIRLFRNDRAFSHGGSGLRIIIIMVVAFLSSLIGFTNLVRYFYPLIGYLGIFFLIQLAIYPVKNS